MLEKLQLDIGCLDDKETTRQGLRRWLFEGEADEQLPGDRVYELFESVIPESIRDSDPHWLNFQFYLVKENLRVQNLKRNTESLKKSFLHFARMRAKPESEKIETDEQNLRI